METNGRHLLVEYHGCDRKVLDDQETIEQLMRSAALAAGASIVTSTFHRFSPQGVSGVVVVEESHLSIHTWPEVGYAAVDFYTCGDCDPMRSHGVLRLGLDADLAEVMRVERGASPEVGCMKTSEHFQHVDEAAVAPSISAEAHRGSLVHRNL